MENCNGVTIEYIDQFGNKLSTQLSVDPIVIDINSLPVVVVLEENANKGNISIDWEDDSFCAK